MVHCFIFQYLGVEISFFMVPLPYDYSLSTI